MNAPMNTTATVESLNLLESVLVVKREFFFEEYVWQGLNPHNTQKYINIIAAKKEFMPRHQAEYNLDYKQIIPYLIFMHHDRVFVMQRKANATESRLQNKYTIGIGGHIRKEDMSNNDLFDWARREFHEEVLYHDAMTITPLGIINDDSNEVGKVHVGFVFLLQGHTDAIAVKSELKSGVLMPLENCMALQPYCESWSSIVLQHIVNTSSPRK